MVNSKEAFFFFFNLASSLEYGCDGGAWAATLDHEAT